MKRVRDFKEVAKEKFKDVKDWCEEHKLQIGVGAASIASLVVLKSISNALHNRDSYDGYSIEDDDECEDSIDDWGSTIDESVFTDLAPEIERALLSSNTSRVIEQEYKDADGTVRSKVEVKVENY